MQTHVDERGFGVRGFDRLRKGDSRRSLLGRAAVMLMLIGLIAARFAGVSAQEATPAPLGFELGPGVTAEAVASRNGSPGVLRVQIAAGATWAASDGRDPSIVLVYGETGLVMVKVEAPVTVYRAATAGRAGEQIAAGAEFDLRSGDYLAAPPRAAAQVRNAGAAPATLVIAEIVPAGSAAPATATPGA